MSTATRTASRASSSGVIRPRRSFPDGGAGLAIGLAAWGERYFEPGAGLAMTVNEDLPAELLKDRREFFSHMDFGTLKARVPAPVCAAARAHGAGRGAVSGRAGLSAGSAARRSPTSRPGTSCRWCAAFLPTRRACSHGSRSCRPGRRASARSATAGRARSIPRRRSRSRGDRSRRPGRGVEPGERSGLRAGQTVSVTPDDYGKVPVTGELVTLDLQEVAIRRVDERAGEVVVHFPRIGYAVAPAS